MAVNLRASVRSVIKELKKNINQKASELASLKDELKRHARAHELLGGDRARTRRPRARGKSNVTVDWNSVLERLPATFTIDNVARVAKKSRGYLRQVVMKWGKQRKIKRTGRGRYRKVQGT